MQDIFITKIHIDKVRHLKNFDIVLSDTERKHLILTGKNGSGKTSLLEAMRTIIFYEQDGTTRNGAVTLSGKYRYKNPGINFFYSQSIKAFVEFIFIYISASRNKLEIPKVIEPISLGKKTMVEKKFSKSFIKYILHLDYQLYGAKMENNTERVSQLEKWFDNFKASLQEIYDCKQLKLKHDTKNLSFNIDIPGREPFGLHEMSDGYTALLEIYMELLMRFEETDAVVNYEQSAVILIDEIETHLHVELQRQVLPFLTRMFPKVQFIVSTHSPFVMTSLENAVVYDLEKHEYLEKPSFYSYETVVESFLDTSMYSNELISFFKRYKALCLKERTDEENEEFLQAKAEIEIRAIPSTELYIAFQDLEKRRKAVKNGLSD